MKAVVGILFVAATVSSVGMAKFRPKDVKWFLWDTLNYKGTKYIITATSTMPMHHSYEQLEGAGGRRKQILGARILDVSVPWSQRFILASHSDLPESFWTKYQQLAPINDGRTIIVTILRAHDGKMQSTFRISYPSLARPLLPYQMLFKESLRGRYVRWVGYPALVDENHPVQAWKPPPRHIEFMTLCSPPLFVDHDFLPLVWHWINAQRLVEVPFDVFDPRTGEIHYLRSGLCVHFCHKKRTGKLYDDMGFWDVSNLSSIKEMLPEPFRMFGINRFSFGWSDITRYMTGRRGDALVKEWVRQHKMYDGDKRLPAAGLPDMDYLWDEAYDTFLPDREAVFCPEELAAVPL